MPKAKDQNKLEKMRTDYHENLLQLGEDLPELRRFHRRQVKKLDDKKTAYEKKLKKIDDRLPSP